MSWKIWWEFFSISLLLPTKKRTHKKNHRREKPTSNRDMIKCESYRKLSHAVSTLSLIPAPLSRKMLCEGVRNRNLLFFSWLFKRNAITTVEAPTSLSLLLCKSYLSWTSYLKRIPTHTKTFLTFFFLQLWNEKKHIQWRQNEERCKRERLLNTNKFSALNNEIYFSHE